METIVKTLLPNLKAEDKPIFGIMTPQHMVEHLTLVIKLSNGRIESKLALPIEKSKFLKAEWIEKDNEFPMGIKAPGLPADKPLPLKYQDLETAKNALLESLVVFGKYFKENPEKTPMHPALGELNYKEWVIFHTKHIKHHFKQFSLI